MSPQKKLTALIPRPGRNIYPECYSIINIITGFVTYKVGDKKYGRTIEDGEIDKIIVRLVFDEGLPVTTDNVISALGGGFNLPENCEIVGISLVYEQSVLPKETQIMQSTRHYVIESGEQLISLKPEYQK